jgi:epoxyqueuosine reductase
MPADLASVLDGHGYKGRAVPITRLRDLEETIDSLCRPGLLAPGIQDLLAAAFVFRTPDEMRQVRSIIVAAAPEPLYRVVFHHQGKARELEVPPTYLYYEERIAGVCRILGQAFGGEGYHFARARVPEKTLAVASGLAQYGRNNITYVRGTGSFYRPMAFYSDMPVKGDPWQKPDVSPACKNCGLCIESCPTGAITEERFLLRAEKCLTYLNEYPGEFPDDLDPATHHCVVGCMVCQTVCPINRGLLKSQYAREEFSDEETALLLEGPGAEQLPRPLAAKLETMGLLEYAGVLPRNLRAVL